MTAATTQPQPKPVSVRRPRMIDEDREFLPAALELLETPPSPVRMAMILVICGFAAAAVVWAYFGRIDIVSIAQGKIQSVGRVKLVQPVETGRVRVVHVKNGDRVNAGDIVVELDNFESRAEVDQLIAASAATRAEALRRAAAIAAVARRPFAAPAIDWPEDIPDAIRRREARILLADLSQLASALASLEAQREQKRSEQTRLTDTIGSQEQLLAIESERLELRSSLEKEKLGSRLNRLDAEESLQQQRTSLAQQKGQLAESVSAAQVLERDEVKAEAAFVAENSQKLADADKQAEDLAQRIAKARVHLDHMMLSAPVSGVVQGLSITSTGQVVQSGEELMRIVPDDGGYEIECYVPNKDIAFIAAGQDAVVKIETFPFVRYGSLPAKVVRVGADAIPEPETAQREADPARSNRTSFTGGAERTQNLYFPVILTPARNYIGDDPALTISNGMAATVEIKTGDRRIIDYLLSPVLEVSSRALKER